MRWLSLCFGRFAMAAFALLLAGFVHRTSASGDEVYDEVVAPFLRQHCLSCHGPHKQSRELRLDRLSADLNSAEAVAVWTEVMDRLNLGEMPPASQKRPSSDDQQRVVHWIASSLRTARRHNVANGGRVLLRRMNRAEYANTIRDLFSIRFLPGEDPSDLLPPDANYEGFQKVASALMLDSSLLGNYYEAAQQVAKLVIVDGPPEFPTHRSHFELEDMAKKGSGFAYMCRSPTVCGEHDVRLLVGTTRTARGLLYPGTEQIIPVKGIYTIRVRASADPGEGDEPVRMFVERQNGREGRILEVDVTAHRSSPQVYSVTLPLDALPEARGVYMKVGIANGAPRLQPHQIQEPERAISVGIPDFFTFEKAMKAAASQGNHAESLRIAARRRSEGWTGSTRPGMGMLDPSHFRKLYVDWIEVEGPIYETWPPRSHQSLFFAGGEGAGEKSAATGDSVAYAEKIFARFLPRAYRRPVTDAELESVVGLVRGELDAGASLEDAVRLGLSYVLTTPSFLYLAEPSVDPSPRELTAYELVSRLSYFLWSSMPDERLFKLAAQGTISDDDLSAEVTRMLADGKSRALVDGFAAQWLKTSEFLDFMPDPKIYPRFYRDFDPQLRESMAREPLEFFQHVLEHDLSVMNFLDSDFAVVNQPLADFYGLQLVKRPSSREQELAFRRLSLPPDSPRGGILGQAGIHMRGSDGIRTKPVNRGVYLREVFFNDPPDPPPPNAGEVEPNIAGERLTVRQRLLQHQQIEACASCHRSIDPYGLALENFDATGAWRDRQNGEDFRGGNAPPIDASGRLPNGVAFQDFTQFKRALRQQQARFRRALIEKLLLYALGRPMTALDREAVEAIERAMQRDGDTLSAAIQAVVASRLFHSK